MDILDSKKVISDSLKSLLGIEKYCKIIETIQKEDFKADKDFQKQFNGYFRVRVKTKPNEWKSKFYQLLESQKKRPLSFEEISVELEKVNQTLAVSFTSKMLAAVNPNLPIWDSFVLKNLGLDKQWNRCNTADKETRIKEAVKIYDEIKRLYSEFLAGEEGQKCVQLFDETFPDYKNRITNVKKIDFWLWSKREEKELKK